MGNKSFKDFMNTLSREDKERVTMPKTKEDAEELIRMLQESGLEGMSEMDIDKVRKSFIRKLEMDNDVFFSRQMFNVVDAVRKSIKVMIDKDGDINSFELMTVISLILTKLESEGAITINVRKFE